MTTTSETGLSAVLEGEVSHDRITRFLSGEDYDSLTLWKPVKPMVRKMESEDDMTAVGLFDARDDSQQRRFA